jgi:hypothetical protein
MDKNKILEEIFADDPFGLLEIKPAAYPALNADDRMSAKFKEINDFFERHQREPFVDGDIQERMLYSRLNGLREDDSKKIVLEAEDIYGLLKVEPKKICSLDDVLADDELDILNSDDDDIFILKHIKTPDERAAADFVARRKPCKNFEKYAPLFKTVQHDLSNHKRELLPFKEDNLIQGNFFVHNGVLLLLEYVYFEKDVYEFKSGARVRKDGRTRIIFENGTESNMLYRSLYKALLDNGKTVSRNIDNVNETFLESFSTITEEDEATGYIYVVRSKSLNLDIKAITNLYKIGYSEIPVEERIKNAEQDPTYLMAPVSIVTSFKCFNMNPQKLELLLHNFFGKTCLNLDIFDHKGNRHTPREWFIVPLSVIEEAITLILTGEIIHYRYDADNFQIAPK